MKELLFSAAPMSAYEHRAGGVKAGESGLNQPSTRLELCGSELKNEFLFDAAKVSACVTQGAARVKEGRSRLNRPCAVVVMLCGP